MTEDEIQEAAEPFVRIAWRSEMTGVEGHGAWKPKASWLDIETRCRELNNQLPLVSHWIEEKYLNPKVKEG